MSQHIGKVFLYELVRNLRRKGFLFTSFGIPVLGFLLFSGYWLIMTSSSNGQDLGQTIMESDQFEGIKKAGYVDLSGHFNDAGSLSTVFIAYSDQQAAQTALEAGEIDVYYVIQQDYMQTGDVTLVMPKFALAQANDSPVRQLLLENLAADVDQNLFQRLINPTNIREINLQRDATGEKASDFGMDFTVVYIFAIVLMLSTFMTSGYLMQTVIEEKETRLIEILVSSMRPTQLLAGKILALGVLGLLQIVAWIGTISLLSRLSAGETAPIFMTLANFALPADKLGIFLAYFLLGYLFFAAAYGMVSAISSSMQEGPQYAVIFTLPAAIPFYFLSIFISTPDAPLPVILSLFPITAPLSMIMRVSMTTVPVWQILLSLGILALTDVAMIWLAGRMFRVNTLLAGQTPKLRDIPKLLRG